MLGLDSTRYTPATYVVQILNDSTLSPPRPELILAIRGQESRMHGVVLSQTGAAITGAAVTLLSGNTPVALVNSNVDGSFALQAAPGTYTVNVAQSGYALFRQQVTLVAGQDQLVMATLGPRSTMTGKVILNTTREAVANLDVVIFDSVGTQVDAMRTNIEGAFAFQDLAVGRYEIALALNSAVYAAATYTCQVLNDGSVMPRDPELVVTTIGQQGKIRGVVTNQTGTPIGGSTVTVLASTTPVAILRAATDGTFSFQIAPGAYTLRITAPNYAENRQITVSVVGGTEQLVVATLGPSSTVTGRVVLNSTREPLPNIRVRVFDAAGLQVGDTPTNVDGTFTFQDLTVGRYDVSLTAENNLYNPASYVFQILNDGSVSPSNPQYQMSVRVQDGTTPVLPVATGTVRDAYSGAPLEYVSCTLSGFGAAFTDAQGRFAFTNLIPGNYNLTLSKPGWDQMTVSFSVASTGGRLVPVPSPLTYFLAQNDDAARGSISGRYTDEAAGMVGVPDLIVRVYRWTLVTHNVRIPNSSSTYPVSNWTLDSASPEPIISTRTGIDDSALRENAGTFRVTNLSPTSASERYLVYIGDGTTRVSTRTYVHPDDPSAIWYLEQTAPGTPGRRHSWQGVEVKAQFTTYLSNFERSNQ